MFKIVGKGVRSRVAFQGEQGDSQGQDGNAADYESLVNVTLPGKDFIFAQASIATSVMLENASHMIKPETAMYVNANGDSWSNESLRANFETFIGAFNFVNHVQEPDKSAGFIADAALRRIIVGEPEDKIFVYYVDILVATSRSRKQLCDLILTSKISFLSMGCDMSVSQCSACGKMCHDEMDLCEHLAENKSRSFIDRQGYKRITCELLGSAEPGSCLFVEASWLTEPPASGAAAIRGILSIDESQSVIVQMPKWASEREAVQMWAGKYVEG